MRTQILIFPSFFLGCRMCCSKRRDPKVTRLWRTKMCALECVMVSGFETIRLTDICTYDDQREHSTHVYTAHFQHANTSRASFTYTKNTDWLRNKWNGLPLLPEANTKVHFINDIYIRFLVTTTKGHIRSGVQKFPAWRTKAAPNGKCCEGYTSMVKLMYQLKSVLK